VHIKLHFNLVVICTTNLNFDLQITKISSSLTQLFDMALTAAHLSYYYGKERATVIERADRDNLKIGLSKK
jgi:hypothetical protein